MVDIRQTESYAKYLRSIGWTVERIDEINYFIKKIPVIGTILKLQRPEETRMDTIKKLCRKYGVFHAIIEPGLSNGVGTFENNHKLMIAHDFKPAKSTYLPSKTLQIDLTLPNYQLIDNMKKDTRRVIQKGSDLIIKSYSTPDEIKIWREAWKKSVKFNRYVPPLEQLFNLRKCFPDRHSLFLASHNITGSIIGGALFTTSSHGRLNYVTYYWYAFTNKEGRSTLSQYSLLYQGILWAKKNGYKIFDFEGIYDPRFPNKNWLGFTHFKRSFGGYEVSYPGCYTKSYLFNK